MLLAVRLMLFSVPCPHPDFEGDTEGCGADVGVVAGVAHEAPACVFAYFDRIDKRHCNCSLTAADEATITERALTEAERLY